MYRIAIIGGGFVGLPNAMKIADILGPVSYLIKTNID